MGIPFINALASHKLAVGFIGVGSSIKFVQKGLIDWKVFWWSALWGIPFVILGTQFASRVDGEIMKMIVGGGILLMIAFSLFQKTKGNLFTPHILSWKNMLVGSILLAPMAFYSGWISAGSGVLTTFLYVYLFRYDQLHATAMTLSANGIFWNAVGAVVHVFMGHVFWALAPGLILGAILGSYLGAYLGIQKGNVFLRTIFLLSAFLTGALLLF